MSDAPSPVAPRPAAAQRLGLWLGPALFALTLALPRPHGLDPVAHRALAVVVWTGAWWLTEAVHAAVAGLLPFVLLPALGVLPAREAARGYQEDAIFLFLGGFLLASALERSEVHRRMAHAVLRVFGARPRPLMFGFCCVTAFTSMWLSNAATTLLLLPAAVALGAEAKARRPDDPGATRFAQALALSVAVCSTIGGLATPVGTVPNSILVGAARNQGFDDRVSFFAWILTGLPLTATLLVGHWLLLTYVTARYPKTLDLPEADGAEARRLPWTRAQALSAGIFAATVAAWLWRSDIEIGDGLRIPGWTTLLANAGVLPEAAARHVRDGVPVSGYLKDGGVAVAAALLLFVVPSRRGGPPLLDWDAAEKRVPWGVLFLLGASFVLADAFEVPRGGGSLSSWFAGALRGAAELPPFGRLLLLAFGAAAISEIGSNTAVAALCVPIGFAAAREGGHDPLGYGFAVAFGASCSFALPVSTPPNTLVYGARLVPLGLMVRHGLLLDVLAAPLIAFVVSFATR
ncbi:MAG TPA: SLC13 family permease [Planctomycetota bacterium]|nr:SLC13 family permease [Planctomycetota bacterium]